MQYIVYHLEGNVNFQALFETLYTLHMYLKRILHIITNAVPVPVPAPAKNGNAHSGPYLRKWVPDYPESTVLVICGCDEITCSSS